MPAAQNSARRLFPRRRVAEALAALEAVTAALTPVRAVDLPEAALARALEVRGVVRAPVPPGGA